MFLISIHLPQLWKILQHHLIDSLLSPHFMDFSGTVVEISWNMLFFASQLSHLIPLSLCFWYQWFLLLYLSIILPFSCAINIAAYTSGFLKYYQLLILFNSGIPFSSLYLTPLFSPQCYHWFWLYYFHLLKYKLFLISSWFE